MYISRNQTITVNYEVKWQSIAYYKETMRGDKRFVIVLFKDNGMTVLTWEEFVALKFEWMRDTGQLKDARECVLQL